MEQNIRTAGAGGTGTGPMIRPYTLPLLLALENIGDEMLRKLTLSSLLSPVPDDDVCDMLTVFSVLKLIMFRPTGRISRHLGSS